MKLISTLAILAAFMMVVVTNASCKSVKTEPVTTEPVIKLEKPAVALHGVPSIELKTLSGQTVNIQDYVGSGKIVVMSFWATWCSPCKRELDAINEIYADWQEDYDVELLAITIDDARSLAKVPAMVETKAWEYTILADSKRELQKAMNFQSVPQTFLIDQEGNIVYTHSGYNPGDEIELEDKIAAIAGK